MITQSESEQITKMFNWSKSHPDIKKFGTYVENGLHHIVSFHQDKTMIDGYGETLTQAMQSYSQLLSKTNSVRKVFNENS